MPQNINQVRACISQHSLQVEAGGSQVQNHPQLHNKFTASLGYKSPCLGLRVGKDGTNTTKNTTENSLETIAQTVLPCRAGGYET